MESYGEILKNKREEKNLELNKIAREISIEERFLKGLEDEDSGVFPGEAYLIGFLKNYSNFLELDTEYLLKLYHNKQLQEAPVPQELLYKPKARFVLPIVLSISAVLIALTLVLVFVFRKKPVEDENVLVSSKVKKQQYELSDKKFNARVYKGDQLIVPTNDSNGKIILTVRDTLSSFGLDTPSGVYYVELSEESELDINGDNISDMILYVSDISSTDDSRGAEISVLLRHGVAMDLDSVDVEEIPFASEVASKHPQRVILEDNRAYPFTVNASFRAACLFRDKVDRENSVEGYFSKGEVFTASPHNGIRLWISNSNVVSLTIIADSKTFDLGMGNAGQVLVEDIKWIKDTDGKYKLVIIELD